MKDYNVAITKESYRNAIKVPDDAIPWHIKGFASVVPTGTEITIFSYRVKNNMKGLRVSYLVYSTQTNHSTSTLRFYRNGNPYDDTLGFLRVGFNLAPVTIPICAIYGSGDLLELRILNQSGANKDYVAYAIGWHF